MTLVKKLYARTWLWLMGYCQHGIYNPYRGLPFNCPACMALPKDYSGKEHRLAEEQAKAVRLAGEL